MKPRAGSICRESGVVAIRALIKVRKTRRKMGILEVELPRLRGSPFSGVNGYGAIYQPLSSRLETLGGELTGSTVMFLLLAT